MLQTVLKQETQDHRSEALKLYADQLEHTARLGLGLRLNDSRPLWDPWMFEKKITSKFRAQFFWGGKTVFGHQFELRKACIGAIQMRSNDHPRWWGIRVSVLNDSEKILVGSQNRRVWVWWWSSMVPHQVLTLTMVLNQLRFWPYPYSRPMWLQVQTITDWLHHACFSHCLGLGHLQKVVADFRYSYLYMVMLSCFRWVHLYLRWCIELTTVFFQVWTTN